MQEKFVGVVKWFNAGKGFGFIGRSEQTTNWFDTNPNTDIFVHYTGIDASGYKRLNEGEIVEFVVVDGNKGKKQAEQVVVISDENKTKQVA